jgi:hypothetical protein
MNTPTLMQSEEEIAPWTRNTKTIEVNISQCLSTIVNIEVPEDFDDYDDMNKLSEFVREQIILPSELVFKHSQDCWYVDDFCVSI